MDSQPREAPSGRGPGGIHSPQISVAMCTYNGAAHVALQLRSILTQTRPPDEIVIGDDASTDDTVAIVESTVRSLRSADPTLTTRVEIVRRVPGLGVRANFEATLAACSGDLIALSDQDDLWHPGKLAALAALFDGEPRLLLAHSDARLVDGAGVSLGSNLLDALEATPTERASLASGAPGDAFAVLMRRNLVTGATVMVRRELVDAARPFADDWVHDEWLAAIAAALGTVRLLPDSLIDYRQHGGNQIGARKPTMADRWAKLREPRAARARRLERRAGALAAVLRRLANEGRVDETFVAAAQSKHDHEAARARLPRWPPARIPAVVVAAARGRYSRYSRGSIDILRDLVQPAGDRAEGES